MSTRGMGRSRGSALIASLMVVTVVAGLGVCLIRLHSAATRRQVHQIDRKRAFYVAEAGLSEAFLAISQGKSGKVGSEDVPASFGDGVFWVDAEPTDDGNIELTSNGLCGVGRFSLSIVLRAQIDPLAARGVFSGTDLVIEPGVIIDGYESIDSSYEEQVAADGNVDHTDGGAMLTSNEDVYLEASEAGGGGGGGGPVDGETQIYGEVHPGPNGSLIAEPGAYVNGSTTPTNHPGIMPDVEIPDAPSSGSMIVPRGQVLTLSEQALHLEGLLVEGGASLVLAGPLTLVVDQLHTLDQSRVVFDTTGGRIVVVVTERLDAQPGTELSSTEQNPRRASLVVSADEWQDFDGDGVLDDPVRFEPEGVFHGFMYVPYEALVLPGTLRFFGAVAAESLTLRAGFRLTVDRSMIDRESGDGALPKFLAWRIVELPDTPLVNIRLDPRGVLNLQGVTPIPSGRAHAESMVTVAYFDAAGALQTYSGLSALLDWTNVKTIVSILWN